MTTTLFFDLDGTLLDTARDFAHAINIMLARKKKPALDFNLFRQAVYGESRKMIAFAFDMDASHPDFEKTRLDFLHTYHQNSIHHTVFFPGIATLLDQLDEKKIPWGIVTSKPSWLTKPIVRHFQLDKRAQCIVMGDTLSTIKPHPAPLLYACERTHVLPENAVYIGDLHTDIIAATAAGMKSIGVTYGYHAPGTDFSTWGADLIVDSPEDVWAWLCKMQRQAY
jgi:phosphoglycolate phosphatase